MPKDRRLIIHPAHTGLGGATASTSRIVRREFAVTATRNGKNRKLLFDVLAAAIRTIGRRIIARCDVLEIMVAASTYVFKNWHRMAPITNNALEIILMHAFRLKTIQAGAGRATILLVTL